MNASARMDRGQKELSHEELVCHTRIDSAVSVPMVFSLSAH